MQYETPDANVIAFESKEKIATYGDIEENFGDMISENSKPQG